MTAHPASEEFEARAHPSPEFAEARNAWLDGFSQLEIAVRKFENRLCTAPAPRGTPLSQRLATLALAKPTSGCSEVAVQQLQKLVRECEKLLPLRATIVHSTMTLGRRDQSEVAIFQNSYDAANDIPLVAMLTQGDFARLGKRLRRLAHGFNTLKLDS
jgi:hypothetical protein